MRTLERIPMVRCRLDGSEEVATLRYIPLVEFDLWRHLMESRHGRSVSVEAVSVWVPEHAAWWNSGCAPEALEPVLRVRFERPGPDGVPIPVERFFPAESYPRAQEALLAHYHGRLGHDSFVATPGYFVTAEAALRLRASGATG
jgi:hypothetical protein